MTKIIISFRSTDAQTLLLGDNDEVAWMTLIKNDGTKKIFTCLDGDA